MKFELVIFLSNNCNLSCRHCTITKNPVHELERKDLETLADYGPYKINLLGGEPLIAENFEDALDVFSDRPITISTNGLLVPEKIKLLEKARMILLSVEGLEKNTNFIRGEEVFEKVKEAAKLLREQGVDVTLRSSIWDGNLKDVPGLIELAEELDTGLMFFPMLGTAPLNPKQQIWLFKQMERCENCWVDQPHYFCYTFGKESYCPAGERRLAVDWNGELHPCQWQFSYHLGKVGDPFDLIEANAQTYVRTFKRPPSKCIGCEFMDSCRGSCPLTNACFGCPLLPEIRRIRMSKPLSTVSEQKIGTIKSFLKGVVSC